MKNKIYLLLLIVAMTLLMVVSVSAFTMDGFAENGFDVQTNTVLDMGNVNRDFSTDAGTYTESLFSDGPFGGYFYWTTTGCYQTTGVSSLSGSGNIGKTFCFYSLEDNTNYGPYNITSTFPIGITFDYTPSTLSCSGLLNQECVASNPLNFTDAINNISVKFGNVFSGEIINPADITTGTNWIHINSSSNLNKPATIQFDNVPVGSHPYRNGVVCGSECSNITNNGNNLIFDVSGFSNYSYGNVAPNISYIGFTINNDSITGNCYATDDNMIGYNAIWKVNGVEQILNESWKEDSTLKSGLSTNQLSQSPTVSWDGKKLIVGSRSGILGYTWNGNGWNSNSSVVNGITSVGNDRIKTELFQINGKEQIIITDNTGTYFGYTWNGTIWNLNSSLIVGLTATGTTGINVFEYEGNLNAITTTGSGVYQGYEWNGTGWNQNNFGDSLSTGTNYYFDIFKDFDGELTLIGSLNSYQMRGYVWNGTNWNEDSSRVEGMNTTQNVEDPVVWFNGVKKNILIGYSNYNFYSYSVDKSTIKPDGEDVVFTCESYDYNLSSNLSKHIKYSLSPSTPNVIIDYSSPLNGIIYSCQANDSDSDKISYWDSLSVDGVEQIDWWNENNDTLVNGLGSSYRFLRIDSIKYDGEYIVVTGSKTWGTDVNFYTWNGTAWDSDNKYQDGWATPTDTYHFPNFFIRNGDLAITFGVINSTGSKIQQGYTFNGTNWVADNGGNGLPAGNIDYTWHEQDTYYFDGQWRHTFGYAWNESSETWELDGMSVPGSMESVIVINGTPVGYAISGSSSPMHSYKWNGANWISAPEYMTGFARSGQTNFDVFEFDGTINLIWSPANTYTSPYIETHEISINQGEIESNFIPYQDGDIVYTCSAYDGYNLVSNSINVTTPYIGVAPTVESSYLDYDGDIYAYCSINDSDADLLTYNYKVYIDGEENVSGISYPQWYWDGSYDLDSFSFEDLGSYHSPTSFIYDGKTYVMYVASGTDTLRAFYRDNGNWVRDTQFENGLDYVNNISNPYKQIEAFTIGDDLIMTAVVSSSRPLRSFVWNGTTWEYNQTYVNGLTWATSSSTYPKIESFEWDGKNWFIQANSMYEWNGTTWVANSSMQSGLSYGGYSRTMTFETNNRLYAITTNNDRLPYGFYYNETSENFIRDDTIVVGIPYIRNEGTPGIEFVEVDEEPIILIGWSVLRGYQYNYSKEIYTSSLPEGGEFIVSCQADDNYYTSDWVNSTPITLNPTCSGDLTEKCVARDEVNYTSGNIHIEWDAISKSVLDPANISTGNDWVSIEDDNFDYPGQLTFSNVPYEQVLVLKDGNYCFDCSDVVLNNSNLSFRITGFSNYTYINDTPIAPTTNNVFFNKSTEYPNQMIGYCEGVDQNADALKMEYKWYSDGNITEEGTTPALIQNQENFYINNDEDWSGWLRPEAIYYEEGNQWQMIYGSNGGTFGSRRYNYDTQLWEYAPIGERFNAGTFDIGWWAGPTVWYSSPGVLNMWTQGGYGFTFDHNAFTWVRNSTWETSIWGTIGAYSQRWYGDAYNDKEDHTGTNWMITNREGTLSSLRHNGTAWVIDDSRIQGLDSVARWGDFEIKWTNGELLLYQGGGDGQNWIKGYRWNDTTIQWDKDSSLTQGFKPYGDEHGISFFKDQMFVTSNIQHSSGGPMTGWDAGVKSGSEVLLDKQDIEGNITFSCRTNSNDGFGWTDWKNSSSLYYKRNLNAPTIDNVSIEDKGTYAEAVCEGSDIEGNELSYEYEWFLDGVSQNQADHFEWLKAPSMRKGLSTSSAYNNVWENEDGEILSYSNKGMKRWNGYTWETNTEYSAGLTHSGYMDIFIDKNGRQTLISNTQAWYWDGFTWIQDDSLRSGLPNQQDYEYWFDGTNENMFVCDSDVRVYGYTWNGSSWITNDDIIEGFPTGYPYFQYYRKRYCDIEVYKDNGETYLYFDNSYNYGGYDNVVVEMKWNGTAWETLKETIKPVGEDVGINYEDNYETYGVAIQEIDGDLYRFDSQIESPAIVRPYIKSYRNGPTIDNTTQEISFRCRVTDGEYFSDWAYSSNNVTLTPQCGSTLTKDCYSVGNPITYIDGNIQVDFNATANGTLLQISDITSNGIDSINVKEDSTLNVPANITFSNVGSDYSLYRNDRTCSDCSSIDFTAGTLSFSVNGFSTYTVTSERIEPQVSEINYTLNGDGTVDITCESTDADSSYVWNYMDIQDANGDYISSFIDADSQYNNFYWENTSKFANEDFVSDNELLSSFIDPVTGDTILFSGNDNHDIVFYRWMGSEFNNVTDFDNGKDIINFRDQISTVVWNDVIYLFQDDLDSDYIQIIKWNGSSWVEAPEMMDGIDIINYGTYIESWVDMDNRIQLESSNNDIYFDGYSWDEGTGNTGTPYTLLTKFDYRGNTYALSYDSDDLRFIKWNEDTIAWEYIEQDDYFQSKTTFIDLFGAEGIIDAGGYGNSQRLEAFSVVDDSGKLDVYIVSDNQQIRMFDFFTSRTEQEDPVSYAPDPDQSFIEPFSNSFDGDYDTYSWAGNGEYSIGYFNHSIANINEEITEIELKTWHDSIIGGGTDWTTINEVDKSCYTTDTIQFKLDTGISAKLDIYCLDNSSSWRYIGDSGKSAGWLLQEESLIVKTKYNKTKVTISDDIWYGSEFNVTCLPRNYETDGTVTYGTSVSQILSNPNILPTAPIIDAELLQSPNEDIEAYCLPQDNNTRDGNTVYYNISKNGVQFESNSTTTYEKTFVANTSLLPGVPLGTNSRLIQFKDLDDNSYVLQGNIGYKLNVSSGQYEVYAPIINNLHSATTYNRFAFIKTINNTPGTEELHIASMIHSGTSDYLYDQIWNGTGWFEYDTQQDARDSAFNTGDNQYNLIGIDNDVGFMVNSYQWRNGGSPASRHIRHRILTFADTNGEMGGTVDVETGIPNYWGMYNHYWSHSFWQPTVGSGERGIDAIKTTDNSHFATIKYRNTYYLIVATYTGGVDSSVKAYKMIGNFSAVNDFDNGTRYESFNDNIWVRAENDPLFNGINWSSLQGLGLSYPFIGESPNGDIGIAFGSDTDAYMMIKQENPVETGYYNDEPVDIGVLNPTNIEGDNYTFACYTNDGEGDSPVSTKTIQIFDTPSDINLISPSNGVELSRDTTELNLTAYVSDVDSESPINVSFKHANGDVICSTMESTGSTVNCLWDGALNGGTTYEWYATASQFDNAKVTTSETFNFSLANTIPVVDAYVENYQTYLEGYCNGTDDEGDPLNYSYVWYKDSVEWSSGSGDTLGTSGVPYLINEMPTEEGFWRLGCMANDGYQDSEWVNSSTMLLDLEPTVVSVYVYPPHLSPQSSISGNCIITDILDGSNITYTYKWVKNGVEEAPVEVVLPEGSLLTTSYGEIPVVNDTWQFACKGNDGTFDSDWTYSPISKVIINSVPNMTYAYTNNPLDTQNLVATCNGYDDNADDIAFDYEVYKNNALFTSGTTGYGDMETNRTVTTISSNNIEFDDEWYIRCRATDSLNESTWMNSTPVTIVKDPQDPISNYERLFPIIMLENESLSATSSGYDLNKDFIDYNFKLYINNVNVENQSDLGLGQNVEASVSFVYSSLAVGDEVKVGIVLSDVDGSANEVFSDTFTVRDLNEAPTVTDIRVYPNTFIGQDDDVTGYCTSEDFESDTVNFEYRWYVNDAIEETGHKVFSNYYGYQSGAEIQVDKINNLEYDEGDYLKFSCRAYDDKDTSDWTNSSAYYIYGENNFAPSMESVTLIPTGHQDTTITFNASANASDNDVNDQITFEWRVVRNGQYQPVSISNPTNQSVEIQLGEISETGTLAGDEYYIKARAYDGVTYSGWMSSNVVYVDNSVPNMVSSVIVNSPLEDTALQSFCDATDIDSEQQLTFIKRWYVNGNYIYDGDTLPASLTQEGQEWILGCNAFDGSVYSGELNSSVATIIGTANLPVQEEITLGGTQTELTGSCRVSDADGDKLDYTYKWYKNGIELPSNSCDADENLYYLFDDFNSPIINENKWVGPSGAIIESGCGEDGSSCLTMISGDELVSVENFSDYQDVVLSFEMKSNGTDFSGPITFTGNSNGLMNIVDGEFSYNDGTERSYEVVFENDTWYDITISVSDFGGYDVMIDGVEVAVDIEPQGENYLGEFLKLFTDNSNKLYIDNVMAWSKTENGLDCPRDIPIASTNAEQNITQDLIFSANIDLGDTFILSCEATDNQQGSTGFVNSTPFVVPDISFSYVVSGTTATTIDVDWTTNADMVQVYKNNLLQANTNLISWTIEGLIPDTTYEIKLIPTKDDFIGEEYIFNVTTKETDNNNPIMQNVSITPSNVYTENPVTGICNAYDVEDDKLYYSYFWKVDNITIDSGVTSWVDRGQDVVVSSVLSNNYVSGNIIEFGCEAYDGIGSSGLVSVNTTVLNTEPVIADELIKIALQDENYACLHSYTDADGDDEINVSYKWYKNDVIVSENSTYPIIDTIADDILMCQISSGDAYHNITKNSSTFSVGDFEAPVIGDISIPDSGYTDTEVLITAECEDNVGVASQYPKLRFLNPNYAEEEWQLYYESGDNYAKYHKFNIAGTYTNFELECKDGNGNTKLKSYDGTFLSLQRETVVTVGGGSGSGSFCGDKTCNEDETFDSCPSDCEAFRNITSFEVKPSNAVVSISPGQTKIVEFEVVNKDIVDISFTNAILVTEDSEAYDWMQFENGIKAFDFEIQKEGGLSTNSKFVRYYIIAPADAEPGTYTGQIEINGMEQTEKYTVDIEVTQGTFVNLLGFLDTELFTIPFTATSNQITGNVISDTIGVEGKPFTILYLLITMGIIGVGIFGYRRLRG